MVSISLTVPSVRTYLRTPVGSGTLSAETPRKKPPPESGRSLASKEELVDLVPVTTHRGCD